MNTTAFVSRLLPCAVLGLALAQEPSTPDAQRPAVLATIQRAAPPAKPLRYTIPVGWERHIVTVKFRDGLMVRLRDGALSDLGTGALGGAGAVLLRMRGGTWSRTHTVAEAELDRMRALGERNVGFPLHDLNLQFRCTLPPELDAAPIIDALNALECVERAESIPCPMVPPQAPDVRHKQGYSEPQPRGTGAGPFQQLPDNAPFSNLAATGGHARIVDIEFGFDPLHVDLPPITQLTPPGSTQPAFDAHGTAVLGMLGARNDGFGTTGMAHAAQLSFAHATSPSNVYVVDQAITTAQSHVGQGGIVLLEVQIAGPRWSGSGTSQFGYLPVEWHYPTWMAIRNAVAAGVTVVEAAGNGSQDLDDAIYGGWFSVQNDSGALLVGAGAAPGGSDVARSRLSFSNFGATVDLQGWGEKVTTTGYGDLYSTGGLHSHYTQTFNGTSSASPVVTGACALLQSLHFERRSSYLMPWEVRAALRRSSTPQQAGLHSAAQNIGPLPDVMRAAIELRLHGWAQHVFAHGFGESLPGNGGNGIGFGPWQVERVAAMVEFDDDGPGPNPTRLYAAGQFSRIGGVPANNIACWNGVGWQALGNGLYMAGGFGAVVHALVVHDADGAGPQLPEIYATGFFDRAGATVAQNIARWNGLAWFAVDAGLGGGGYALATIDEDGPGSELPSLVVGGDFTTAGGLPASRIARFRNNGWSDIGSGFDSRIAALEVWDADDSGPGLPRLVAGGSFSRTGNWAPMRGLATWNGGSWSAFGGGVGTGPADQVWALEAVPMANMGTQALAVGGTFYTVAGSVGVLTQGLAIWHGGWQFPSTPAGQPTAMAAFDDGIDPSVPRQKDLFLAAGSGLFRLDMTNFATLQLATGVTASQGMVVHDGDGAGVEPPALFIAGGVFTTFPGPVNTALGLAKLFGATPVPWGGFVTALPTGCGGPFRPTIATAGDPVLGAPFTVQFDCLPMSLPAMCVGLPEPVPLPICGGQSCALGVQPLLVEYGRRSLTYTFPNDPVFHGVVFAFQGFELLALPYGQRCAQPYLPIDLRTSDTLVLHF